MAIEALPAIPEPESFVEPLGVAPEQDPFVLVVEPMLEWRKFMGNTLKKAGVRYEVVPNARVALMKLEHEKDDQFTAVITDGLHGSWTEIVESARERGVDVVLTSKSSLTVRGAQRKQIPAFLKNDLKDKYCGALERLMSVVAPQNTIKEIQKP